MRLSEMTGAPLEVIWHQDSGIGRTINDPLELFSEAFVRDHVRLQDGIPRKQRNDARFLRTGPPGLSALRQHLAQGNRVLVDNPVAVTQLADEDREAVLGQLAALWRCFPFSEVVRKAVDLLRPKLGAGTVCHHLRRGDLVHDQSTFNRPWPGKFVPDEAYHAHLDRKLREGRRAILFSDDPATIRRLRSRHPGIIAFDDLLAELPPITEGQRDLIELVAISLCAEVFAPQASAFSLVAARLGGTNRVVVDRDLTPEERDLVRADLLKRLSTPSDDLKGPGVAGDAGQSLLYLEQTMREAGRSAEALPAIRAHVDAGLDISFVYPLLMRLQLEAGDPQAALETHALALRRGPYQPEDQGRCDVLGAVAHALTGDDGTAATLALRAFWHHLTTQPDPRDPDATLIPEVIGLMIERGWLDNAGFLPLGPVARRLARVPAVALEKGRYGFLKELLRAPPDAPMTLPDPSALAWDWHLFMGGVAGPKFARNRARSDAYGFLIAEAQLDPSPDALSLLAVHDALTGDAPAAFARIEAIAADRGGEAILQYRLSVCALLANKPEQARRAALAACTAAPDVAGFRAWRGRLGLRSGAVAEGLADLEQAVSQGWSIPPVHLLIAEAAAELGRPERQRSALEAALAQAPHFIPALLARAALHAAAGEVTSALADLDRIEARSPGHKRAAELRDQLAR